MYKKTIKYTDYNGKDREEDLYFNFTEAELAELQSSVEGGYAERIQKIAEAKDTNAIIALLKELIIKSYGVKSEDGRLFIKKPEITEEFTQTPAYSIFYMMLARDEKKLTEFINGIMPSSLMTNVDKAKVENLTANKPSNE